MEMQTAQCQTCGTKDKLLRCAKCRKVFYCSSSHQHKDWPRHKRECNELAKQKNNARSAEIVNRNRQQLQHVISVASNSLNNTSHPPTPRTTYPLANAASSINQVPMQIPANDTSINYYDDSAIVENHGSNHNLHNVANEPTMSVIYNGTSPEQCMPHSQQTEQMLVDAAIMQQMPYYADSAVLTPHDYVDANTNNTTVGHPLTTQMEQLLLTPEQQNEYQLTPEQYQQPQLQQQQQQQQQTYAQFRNQNSQYEKTSSYQIGLGDANAMANFNERRYEELCRNIINDMNHYGLSVVDDFLGAEKGMDVLGEVHNMYCAGVFQDGQLVNNSRTEQDLNKTIRGDKITWVKGVEPGCTNVGYLINQIDAVIMRANTMLNNGKLGNYNIKERTKAMVACYPGSGAHYVTHVDNPNKDGRVITAIYYLNVDWDSKRCGGVLRIFPEASNTVADIEPKFDRLIFFWSDKRNPHEVQPSHRTRYAITVWYFDANEREAALNRCKYGSLLETGSPASSSTNSSSNSSKTNLHQSQICT